MLKEIKKIKQNKQHKTAVKSPFDTLLRGVRRSVVKQALLAGFTIMVTLILVFAMTTAWYTNVVETSGLMFEAETWGFEGEVAVQDHAVKAAPGDSGIVYLTVTNNSDDVSAITVNVTREYMTPVEMHQRIFFYVDEPSVVNGESVNKQYLTNTTGHTYTLFSRNKLILSEQLHTDSLLKWEWVYDVVGYYFRGTVTEDSVTVEEYLRPVEYSYDDAVYDEEGRLLMVDSETSVNAFLQRLTASDGFAGAFTVNDEGVLLDETGAAVSPVNGCYPVHGDHGETLWIYLCTKDQIEENTRWDTEFGKLASGDEAAKFQARISVTAQQVNVEPVMISDPEKLEQALLEANGGIVRLESSLALSETVELDESTDAVLDLNGHSITYTASGYAFDVEQGGELTVLNGTIHGDPELANSAFKTVGGQITLSHVTMDDMYEGVFIADNTTQNQQGSNAYVRIVDCELITNDITVRISGDGTLSGEDTCLVIQDSTLISERYVAVLGNGNAKNPGNWGTDIQIIDSEISGYYAAVYHPQQQSTLTASGSTLSGMTGIAVKGGQVNIIDCIVKGTGTDGQVVGALTEDMLNGNGWQDTGDGIYVESDYGKAITIEVAGDSEVSSVASTAGAIRVFPEANYVEIRLFGGKYSHDVNAYLADGYVCSRVDGYYVVQKSE